MPALTFMTSWGEISALWDEKGLYSLTLPEAGADSPAGPLDKPDGLPGRLQAELEAYFSGGLRVFDLPLVLPAGPPFFLRAWQGLARIPYGQVISYRELAAMAGNERALRAAGAAMRHNPLPLVLPCHRVIASDGSLGGFSGQVEGAALDLKKRLLLLEGHRFDSKGRLL